MYCLKCKQKTDTINVNQLLSKNNRKMAQGNCVACGSKKSCFIKSSQGNGLFNTALQNLPLGELHLPTSQGEYVPNGSFNNTNKYSFCGPFTQFKQRDEEGYQGTNPLDGLCKIHDKFYSENQDTKSRNISDVALAHGANEIANDPRFDRAQRRDAKFVSAVMNAKAKLGLGNPLNLRRGPMKL